MGTSAKPEIEGLAHAARLLAEERAALAKTTPFGAALEETRHDLGRIAVPVVAIVGQAKAGKSALINALVGKDVLPSGVVPTTALPVCLRAGPPGCMLRRAGRTEELEGDREAIRARIREPQPDDDYLVWQLPELASVPWHWLDTPGWDAVDRDRQLDLDPWDLADVWVLTTSATHPMAAGDRLLMAQVAALAAGSQITVVITRCDQVDETGLDELSAYVERQVREVWPKDPPPVLRVSSAAGQGLDGLRDRLRGAVRSFTGERLAAEIGAWQKTLDQMDELGRMRSLAALESDTVDTAREHLHADMSAAMADLKGSVDALAQEVVVSLVEELPAAQRSIAPLFAQRLEQRVTHEIDVIGRRLENDLAQVLGGDLQQKGSVNLALRRFTTLIDRRGPEAFEARGAVMGASLGVSAGLSAALFATLPMIGIPFAVASVAVGLAGGALGALLGGREIIVDTERLRERVAVPLAQEVVAELDRVTAAARLEIDRLCDVMEGAASLQHEGPSTGHAAAVRAAVDEAKARAVDLAKRVEALRSESAC